MATTRKTGLSNQPWEKQKHLSCFKLFDQIGNEKDKRLAKMKEQMTEDIFKNGKFYKASIWKGKANH